MQMMVHMEDRYGQLIALNGMAKTLGLMRRQSKICDCRPLEINNKVIDLASSLGCKVGWSVMADFPILYLQKKESTPSYLDQKEKVNK